MKPAGADSDLGWSVTLFRMSYDAELGYIVDQQHFAVEWYKDSYGNLEIMEALVRHVVGLLNLVTLE